MAITSTIVQVNAIVTENPAPSLLQQSGAFVSAGGTTLTTGTWQYLADVSQLASYLSSAGNYLELVKMNTTFFAQGSAVGVYVLELGVQSTSPDGITALQTWITANPQIFYAYEVPVAWDASGSALNTMAANYSSPTGKTYFFVTTTSGTISAYAGTKSIFAVVNSPTAASTEFQASAFFYQWLANDPTSSSPAAPMSSRFLYGVTPWSLNGNQTTTNTLLTAYANIILTGAEGGISTSTARNGTTSDGEQAMSWYAIDWVLINAKQRLAAAVINGSNSNPPLYYNQTGINLLLAILTDMGMDGVTFGLLLSQSFAATSFSVYTAQNPGDYDAGIYKGFSATVKTQVGFLSLTFNLDAIQF